MDGRAGHRDPGVGWQPGGAGAVSERSENVPVAAPLPAQRLGAVFGRDHVVHVVVAPGRLAEALKLETDRLAGVAGPGGGMEQAE